MLKTSHFHLCFISVLILIFFSTTALCQETFNITREDNKSVPIVVYFPDNACKGIAIISHGAGASEIVFYYLGAAMAAQDYLTVVPGHQESGLDLALHLRSAKGVARHTRERGRVVRR